MNHEILQHIPQYGVLLCTICKEPHCVPLAHIGDHFLKYHSVALDKAGRKEIVKYAQTFKDKLMDPNDVKTIVPPFEHGPIQGLHKVYGFECNVCKKLLARKYSMEQHCREHGWKTKQVPMWTQKWMQVYTKSSLITDILEFFQCSAISKLFPHQCNRKPPSTDYNSTTSE
jgi:Orsellinic acid/F9775 biosynthesis cluster protein D